MSDSDQTCDDCGGPLGLTGYLDRWKRIGRLGLCRKCAGGVCQRLLRYIKGLKAEEKANPMRQKR